MTTQQDDEYIKAIIARRRAEAAAQREQAEPAKSVKEAESKPKAGTRTSNEWALGIVLLIAGALGWLSGARYTLFGGVAGLNLFLEWLGLPARVPMPSGWWVLIALPLGFVYSRVETRIWHKRNAVLIKSPLFWIGWLLIVGTDVGSTWLGVRAVQDDSWYITQQLAANGWIALVWSTALTFGPEWLILGALRFIRR
jgi:hypothetical protein